MNWPAPGKEPLVRTTILDTTPAKSAAQPRAREKQVYVGPVVWIWWSDGSRSGDGRVGAAAVCKHRAEWRSRRSVLGTGSTEVFDSELSAMGLTLDVAIEKGESLQEHGVKTVAVITESRAAIQPTVHLEPGPGQ